MVVGVNETWVHRHTVHVQLALCRWHIVPDCNDHPIFRVQVNVFQNSVVLITGDQVTNVAQKQCIFHPVALSVDPHIVGSIVYLLCVSLWQHGIKIVVYCQASRWLSNHLEIYAKFVGIP